LKKFGIFGGSFNPPHIAHSIVADDVRQQLGLDKIIFIPSGNHPLKMPIEAKHRLAMARLAFSGDKNFEVSDIEVKNEAVKSYTVNTLQALNEIYKKDDVKLYFITGIDNLIEFPKWKEPEKLFELAEIVVMSRPDFLKENILPQFSEKVKFIDVPLLEVSSTKIRELVSEKKSIRYLVSSEVNEYIIRNKLYCESP